METAAIIQQIYTHVESGHVDKAVFACIRLARSIGDVLNLLTFMRELSSDSKQFKTQFFEETKELSKDSTKYLWDRVGTEWLTGRTLQSYSLGQDEKGEELNVLTSGVGELHREIEQFEKHIIETQVPAGMGEYDTAAFTDKYVNRRSVFRLRIGANNTVIERIRTRCLNYASRIEKQIAAQSGNVNFLSDVQSIVNNYFSGRSQDTYIKLMKAAELVNSSNPEDAALLLTSVRRAISAVADFFYPSRQGDVVCRDGVTRKMGNEQYMNRLQEYCMGLIGSSTSDELLAAELAHLATFARRLNDVASKGVHAEVEPREAKQGLIGLYMFLSNVITRLETN